LKLGNHVQWLEPVAFFKRKAQGQLHLACAAPPRRRDAAFTPALSNNRAPRTFPRDTAAAAAAAVAACGFVLVFVVVVASVACAASKITHAQSFLKQRRAVARHKLTH
jgi:ABC-type Fe2+-enterobactin transport system substrate-binding protein